MWITLYVLRENGRPLTYAEVKARPRPQGRLVLGTRGDPEVHARLLGDWPEMNAPKLSHARVIRIGNGCILLFGQQWQPSHPYPRQTWLCALSEEAGEAALRKIRPPRPSDFPFGGLEDDNRPD